MLKHTNGEIHFIFKDSLPLKDLNESKVYDETEARKVSKLEALKPLLLIRN
jgi:hypothetical protein